MKIRFTSITINKNNKLKIIPFFKHMVSIQTCFDKQLKRIEKLLKRF